MNGVSKSQNLKRNLKKNDLATTALRPLATSTMGVSSGRKGFLNLQKNSHRIFVVKTLTTPGLNGDDLFQAMLTYVNDDSLSDNKNKAHAARLVVWLASCDDGISYNDMKWFTPCLRYLRMDTWKKGDCYADAIPFARMLMRLHKPIKKASAKMFPDFVWVVGHGAVAKVDYNTDED